MAKTQQQYYNEIINPMKQQVEQMYAGRTEADARQKEQINAAIDQATKTATAQYEQRLEALPGESRALYDKNALNEAVGRMKVRETLANMGLTDSGLSSSMATALTVQKGRADHEVSVNEQKQRQALMSAIDQIFAQGETQKADKAMTIDNATRQWYDELNARTEETARSAAATAYEADQKHAAEVESARIKAAQEAAKYQADYDKQRRQYVQKQMTDGATYEQAMANAYVLYPATEADGERYKDVNNYYENYYAMLQSGYTPDETSAYMGAGGGEAGEKAMTSVVAPQAQSILASMDLDFTAGGGGIVLRNPEKDGERVANRILEQLGAIPAYAAMSQTAQEYTKAAAVGQMVAKSFSNASQSGRNQDRIAAACAALGVDKELAVGYYEDAYSGDGSKLYDWMMKNFVDPYNTVSSSAVSFRAAR